MPDTRFSWRALLEHLRKFGAIYLIGIAVCLFGTNLLWTMTAPTIPPEQSVIVYLAAGYSNPEPLSGIANEMLTETQKMDNTLRSVEFQSLQYIESEMDYTGPMTLLARLSVGEGDAFLASRQVMDQLVLGGALLPLDEIVENGWMKQFELEPYYVTVEDGETGEESTYLAGLRIDTLDALSEMDAFRNEDAFLALPANGTNQDTTLYAREIRGGAL
ncbi:MAG: hypothetical protein J6M64_08155, partial [Oscillospiraceae bacterium]|nr:hypothetical protein [Oscillospiraceae bacterium]